jgi:hypothetical protein
MQTLTDANHDISRFTIIQGGYGMANIVGFPINCFNFRLLRNKGISI